MNLVVEIDGRAAIPVRAIPLLTNWETMSPDVVAMALAWDDHFYQFKGLCAYSVENGVAGAAIDATWWENFPCRKLTALSEQIKATEISHEVGYDEWRSKALPVLPAGVFVWKDEFEPRYYIRYGPNGTTFLLPGDGGKMSSDEQDRRVKLNFEPFIHDVEVGRCAMQGFEAFRNETPCQDTPPDLTIRLPVGTKTVPVVDIPTLIAVAKYPRMLTTGTLPEGAKELAGDEAGRIQNVQLYKLEMEHNIELTQALEKGARRQSGGVPAYSILDGRICTSVEKFSDCYVEIDDFKAYIETTFRGKLKVQIGDKFPAGVIQSVTVSPLSDAVRAQWELPMPKRLQGYGRPLYEFLKKARVGGHAIPTARDVLDAWRDEPPPEVFEVMNDELKYYGAKGQCKPADLEAIRKAIRRMIK